MNNIFIFITIRTFEDSFNEFISIESIITNLFHLFSCRTNSYIVHQFTSAAFIVISSFLMYYFILPNTQTLKLKYERINKLDLQPLLDRG